MDDDSMFLGEKKKLTKTQCDDIEDVEYEVVDISQEDYYFYFLDNLGLLGVFDQNQLDVLGW